MFSISEQLLHELTVDGLPEQYKRLAGKIGLETLVSLSQALGGTQQYIPMTFELTKELMYQKVRDEFTGYNIQDLALKYLLSESTVRRIVQEQINKRRCSPLEGQVSIFDEIVSDSTNGS